MGSVGPLSVPVMLANAVAEFRVVDKRIAVILVAENILVPGTIDCRRWEALMPLPQDGFLRRHERLKVLVAKHHVEERPRGNALLHIAGLEG